MNTKRSRLLVLSYLETFLIKLIVFTCRSPLLMENYVAECCAFFRYNVSPLPYIKNVIICSMWNGRQKRQFRFSFRGKKSAFNSILGKLYLTFSRLKLIIQNRLAYFFSLWIQLNSILSQQLFLVNVDCRLFECDFESPSITDWMIKLIPPKWY